MKKKVAPLIDQILNPRFIKLCVNAAVLLLTLLILETVKGCLKFTHCTYLFKYEKGLDFIVTVWLLVSTILIAWEYFINDLKEETKEQ